MGLLESVGRTPCVAMLGMCKNAGKTTAMNRLAAEAAGAGRLLALTSIGRDGERTDLVTGTAKPPVWMRRGMLCATAAELLPFCDASRELLDVTGLSTPLGPVVIFRARSDGFVQLAGPSIVAHMRQLCARLAELGAELTLIDGALSRRSPAAAGEGCCILSTGAGYDRDMARVVEDTAYVCRLMALSPCGAPHPGGDSRFTAVGEDGDVRRAEDRGELESVLKAGGVRRVYLRGALTDALAAALTGTGRVRDGVTLTVEDSSRLLLSRGRYEKLTCRGGRVDVQRATRVAAVTVNPTAPGGWRFDKAEFAAAMAAAVPAPVFDVEELP